MKEAGKDGFVLDVNISLENTGEANLTDVKKTRVYLPVSDEVAIGQSDDAEWIELEDGQIVMSLPINKDSIKSGEKVNISATIPVLGKPTQTQSEGDLGLLYDEEGELLELGAIGSTKFDYSVMDKELYFEANAKAIANVPGFNKNQFALGFSAEIRNLLAEDVDSLDIEFNVPDTIKIYPPESYESGDLPDYFDLPGIDDGLNENLDLKWNSNTATVNLPDEDFGPGTGYQLAFSALGEAKSLDALKGLKVTVKAKRGDNTVEEITVPLVVEYYEDNVGNDDNNDDNSGSDKPSDDDKNNGATPIVNKPDNNKKEHSNDKKSNNNKDKSSSDKKQNKQNKENKSGHKLPNTGSFFSIGFMPIAGASLLLLGALLYFRSRKLKAS
ncbi:LPXTG cell wall anchor domain-containing protein [Metabacillus arenae]|uniref:LPXTG cell wall anchor domain-containing protein n=1 Tax=Metabacillus arenae TaxID=2771434 RepID=A0A926NBV9_9BACI|nr:LPXTG cell wall anchor domain-containing protein [Metabacillus arenae]MBD1381397.1 LPXTG cell wall anchor domain-containing protein [Metabacillus arenae]